MNWQTKKLGELGNYINGYPFKPSDWKREGLPIIRIQNLNDEAKEFNYFSGQLDNKYIVKNDDILISWSASLGSYIWKRGNAWLNQHIFKVIVNEKVINKDFFPYLSQTVLAEMKSKTHGGTMKHITKGVFENINVKLPPPNIQQQIVKKLDLIRKLQELNQKEIEKAEELFNSYLSKYSKISIGKQTKTIGEIVEVITKGTTPTTYGHSFTNKGVPFLRVENIMNDAVNPLDTTHYIDAITNKLLDRSRTKPNDILVTIAGTIGRIGYVPNNAPEMNMNQAVAVIRTKPELLNYLYLFYLLQTKELQNQMNGARVTGTITNISLTTIKNLKIFCPPVKEQIQVAEKLNEIMLYKKLLITRDVETNNFFESALNKLMRPNYEN